MAPIILRRALSFSNPPLHRRDVSPLQEASAVSNRPEGVALLTAIAEGTGCCNPCPPLTNHSALEKSLISKILRLRVVLDLPCQSSCDALDQLLLDTLRVLKIAYPKCLSGLSGNHTSVREGLVHLHKVLMLVQDRHSKNKQFPSTGSEKQTIIGSESLDDIGGRVIEMLDQVTPVVKEMLSFMETSSSATAASASSAWPEDLPERSRLPPVLCRTRSPAHRAGASHRPSDGDEVAMPRQDGTARHTEHCKALAPGQEEEDGQTSRREPSPTPSPTADFLPLQSTPSSVSPHLLSAPPPSPMPVVGLPMLLQSWEAMQDGHAAAAVVPPTVAAEPSDAAPTTAPRDTTPVSVSIEGSTSSASLEASQPSPSMDSPSASPDGSTKPLVQDSNAAVPNVPPPPPPPPPAYRDRFQEGPPSTDEPGQAVTLTNAPPPPPSEGQGGPPAPPATKVSPAPPPPPPAPGSISALVRGKKAATKLKRSTQMGTLYRRLRDRVEGSGSTHGGKRRQNGKRPRKAGAPKSEAGGQGMADALAEMTKRSAYFRQIEEDAEKHAAAILELKDAIGSFQSKDMDELVRFHEHVEQRLVSLTDETQVLARFEGFPSKKLEALRTAAALFSKLDGAAAKLKCWKLAAGPVSSQLDGVESYFNKVKDDVGMVERNKDEETKRLQSHGVHFDFSVLVRIKEGMVDLSSACVELALKESQDARETTAATTTTRAQWASSHGDGTSRLLWRVFQLAFRVYSFAGGQDERADRLTSTLAHEIEARRL